MVTVMRAMRGISGGWVSGSSSGRGWSYGVAGGAGSAGGAGFDGHGQALDFGEGELSGGGEGGGPGEGGGHQVVGSVRVQMTAPGSEDLGKKLRRRAAPDVDGRA